MSDAKGAERLPILESKLITCILPKDSAFRLIKRLKREHGITTASVNHARGLGTSEAAGKKGIGIQIEKDILTVVVPEDKADEIFDYIYVTADINRPHGGFMYMTALRMSVPFLLPDLPEEKI